jgi:hypothetical protein
MVNVRPVRIAALTIVVIAAILQLSFGSRTPFFRAANVAILLVAGFVLWRLLISAPRRS